MQLTTQQRGLTVSAVRPKHMPPARRSAELRGIMAEHKFDIGEELNDVENQ